MKLLTTGIAGTMESGDILIEIEEKQSPGVEIELSSTVGNQYGRKIKEVMKRTIAENGLDGVLVKATDKGALDCTIRARVTAAVLRGCQVSEYRWE